MSKFNGGFCVASQEAYDLLIKSGCNKSAQVETWGINPALCFEIANNTIIQTRIRLPPKQFYINNGALSWDEPKGEKDGNINMVDTCNNASRLNDNNMDSVVSIKTLSITDEDGKIYEFEKPSFECELLKIVDDKIIGWYRYDDGSGKTSAHWFIEGN